MELKEFVEKLIEGPRMIVYKGKKYILRADKYEQSSSETYRKYIKYIDGKITNKLTEQGYMRVRADYYEKLIWFKEVKKCVDWLIDNNKRTITPQRLRNWMRKTLEFQKDQERKVKYKDQDSNRAKTGQRIHGFASMSDIVNSIIKK